MSTTDPSVVCGVDGSRASAAAIRVAARLASAMNRRLILTSAVADRSAGPSAGPGLQTFCRIERAEILVLSSQEESPGVAVSEAAGGGKCPVIAVPPGAAEGLADPDDAKPGHIVCGVDGSMESVRAVRIAATLAQRLELTLKPRHVLSGDVADALAKDGSHGSARLIAVGARGRGAVGGAPLGSVADRLAVAAPVPVLIVPGSGSLLALALTRELHRGETLEPAGG